MIDALRAQPDNIQLLVALGTLYVDLQDWGRAQGVIDRLDDFGEDTAGITNNLTARMLAAQGNEEALLSFLETLSQDQTFGQAAEIGLIQSYIGRGDLDTALSRVESALQEAPDDPALRFVKGSVLAMQNRPDEAETVFRALLEDRPETEQVWLALYRLKTIQGETDAAEQVLSDGLAALPGNLSLLWVKAGGLERRGDIEGAIGIYDDLYAQHSHIPLFANNLASLLASYRDDADSLERAYTIARRLRGTEVPAFQDTYGWIAYRRGDFDDALLHLEPAAQGLPDDPMVQYHLGATYAALNRNPEALEAFQAVIALDPPAPLLETVTAAIKDLTAEPEIVSTTGADN